MLFVYIAQLVYKEKYVKTTYNTNKFLILNGLEIKKNRKNLKLTQTAFGKMLGVSLRTVQSWESGDRNIPNSTLKLLNSQLKSAETTYLNEPKDTSDSGLYGYGDSIRLDLDSLLKSKEDLHKLVFFFNDNIDALSKNEVVGIFLERLRSDYRAEYKLELAALLNKNTKLNEDEIKAILTSKPQKTN